MFANVITEKRSLNSKLFNKQPLKPVLIQGRKQSGNQGNTQSSLQTAT
jgi:hypothetical protein